MAERPCMYACVGCSLQFMPCTCMQSCTMRHQQQRQRPGQVGYALPSMRVGPAPNGGSTPLHCCTGGQVHVPYGACQHEGDRGDDPEPDRVGHGPQDGEQPLPGLPVHLVPGARHKGASCHTSALAHTPRTGCIHAGMHCSPPSMHAWREGSGHYLQLHHSSFGGCWLSPLPPGIAFSVQPGGRDMQTPPRRGVSHMCVYMYMCPCADLARQHGAPRAGARGRGPGQDLRLHRVGRGPARDCVPEGTARTVRGRAVGRWRAGK